MNRQKSDAFGSQFTKRMATKVPARNQGAQGQNSLFTCLLKLDFSVSLSSPTRILHAAIVTRWNDSSRIIEEWLYETCTNRRKHSFFPVHVISTDDARPRTRGFGCTVSGSTNWRELILLEISREELTRDPEIPKDQCSQRPERVVVTGLGAVTPLGAGIKHTWRRLVDSDSGLVSTSTRGTQFGTLPSRVAGLVPRGSREDGKWQAKDWLSASYERQMALFAQYAIASAQEALDDAGWHPTKQEDLEATGVTIGSGIGNLDEAYNTSVAFHEGGYRKVSPLFVPRLLINLAAGHISIRHGFKGPNHAATTACTTGLHAIGDASRLIAFGDADVMVAGGAESCIHPLAIAGFARARSLATVWNDDPKSASRPFDRDRGGFVIGEGAGVVVLEELEHAKLRNAEIYAEIRGYGLSSDAFHITAPKADGEGAFLAMRHALRHAQFKPGDIDYVNAHATSTTLGDAAENAAIKRLLLGEHGRQKTSELNISSTKGAIGHLLGAAGAVEAIFTMLAIHQDILPPTLNLNNPGDPAQDFDCNYVPKTAQNHVVNAALTNSFGFGGTNASLCLAKYT
nr:putative 3-oxoacyl-[acyl-carrier-protein] synthase, mitochondrial [Quercus suber]